MTRILIKDICETFNKSLDDDALNKLTLYFNTLFLWNKRINLTGIKDENEAIKKHLCDTLAVIDLIKPKKVLDIGTGAGIPGLILKILNAELDVYLVEASRKKVSFLNYTTALLRLKDVNIINERLNYDMPSKSILEHSPFDTILSQAVGNAQIIFRLSRYYVSKNTLIIIMKGKDIEKEIKLIEGNVVGKVEVKRIYVPILNVYRYYIIIREVVRE